MGLDRNDQMENLLAALEQLNRLASMDSAEYGQRLLVNSVPSLEEGTVGQPMAHHGRQLQLPSAPLSQLSMSLHRLHSVVANLTHEVDGHSEETVALQAKLEASQDRSRTLERAVRKLHERNLKLKKRSERDRRVSQQLIRRVRDDARQLEDQGFQLMASQVQQHEIRLLLGQQQLQGAGTRGRADSSFSDLVLDDDDDDDYANAVPAGFEVGEAKGDSKDVPHSDTATLLTDAQSVDSTTTSSSTRSATASRRLSLFEEVSPTLRISMHGSISVSGSQPRQRTWSGFSSATSSGSMEDSAIRGGMEPGDILSGGATVTATSQGENPIMATEESVATADNSQRSPHRAKDTVPTSSSSSNATIRNMPSLHNNNPFAKFLGPRTVQSYSLTMVPSYEMQFVALPTAGGAAKEKQLSSDAIENSSCEDVGRTNLRSASSAPLRDGSLMETEGRIGDDGPAVASRATSSLDEKVVATTMDDVAYAVCGFNGFDASANVKPTLGARLLAINGVNVNPQWTLDELYGALNNVHGVVADSGSRNETRKRRTTLTFRNDEWDHDQKRVLTEAINGDDEKKTLAIAEKETTNASIDTNENIGGGSQGREGTKNRCDSDKPLQHFLRSRTASGDNVGKAINGIGNFFHSLHQQHDKTSTIKRAIPTPSTGKILTKPEEKDKGGTESLPGKDTNRLQETNTTNEPEATANETLQKDIGTSTSLKSREIQPHPGADQDRKSEQKEDSGPHQSATGGQSAERQPGPPIESGAKHMNNVMSFFVNVMNQSEKNLADAAAMAWRQLSGLKTY